MKKIFLFAAAAMVSLSSCVQTEEVYTGALHELGFNSAVTRGIIQEDEDMVYPISVGAILDNTDPSQTNFTPYFENAEFVYDEGNQWWKGNPAKYWPTSGDMHFIGLCPYPVKASVKYTYKADGTYEKVTFGTIDNNLMDQHDVLYSDLYSVEAPQTGKQPLLFHHAYAQLNVTFKKTASDAAVVVNSVSVEDVNLSGILEVTPVIGGTSTAVWTIGLPVSRFFLDDDATGVEDGVLDAALHHENLFSPKPVVVIPGAQTEIVIEYTIDGYHHTYTHKLTGDWKMGYKYTYNYTINVSEILFDCTVEGWIPEEGGNITI
ncbi:MAG: fimbrillin family protein [Alistipes sp.]|nr:fimbrillin family protein [Alistipes sp.]